MWYHLSISGAYNIVIVSKVTKFNYYNARRRIHEPPTADWDRPINKRVRASTSQTYTAGRSHFKTQPCRIYLNKTGYY